MQDHHILVLGFRPFTEKILVVFLTICLCIVPAFSKDKTNIIPAGNWGAVEFLEKDATITISMNSGDKTEGKFLALEADSIRLMVDKQERIFPQASITEVWQRVPDSKLNGILIGAGIGLIAGNIVARAGGTVNTGDSGARALGGGIIMAGLGLGALFGGITDASIKGNKLIYRK
jgi:hypothetical protein